MRIDLNALKEGENLIARDLQDEFFATIEADTVRKGSVHVRISALRKGERFEFAVQVKGVVNVPCDLCLDDLELLIENEGTLLAQLGDHPAEADGLVVVDKRAGWIDLSWFVYETIVLAVPLRHVHAPGACNPRMTDLLAKYSAKDPAGQSDEAQVDARWAALLKLKDKN